MKLYYYPGACSLAAHIVLEWVGKPYELQKVNIHPKSADLLAVNPVGAVPVIADQGWVLTQNSAILNYLADTFPEAELGGDGTPESRAEVNRWLGMVNSDMHPAFKPLFGATAYLEDEVGISKSQDNARQVLRNHFETLNGHLEGRDWLAGLRSVADPYLFVLLRWAKALKLDMAGLDNLDAFFARMQADTAVAKVLKAEDAG